MGVSSAPTLGKYLGPLSLVQTLLVLSVFELDEREHEVQISALSILFHTDTYRRHENQYTAAR